MRSLIRRSFPDHGIIGEEFGKDRPDAEYVWLLDPIDGTKSFISGMPAWGTLIGLTRLGEPIRNFSRGDESLGTMRIDRASEHDQPFLQFRCRKFFGFAFSQESSGFARAALSPVKQTAFADLESHIPGDRHRDAGT